MTPGNLTAVFHLDRQPGFNVIKLSFLVTDEEVRQAG
jgi:hypothetical protein